MVEAENGKGECGGGLLVDITAGEEPVLASRVSAEQPC